jgi:2-dehydro-3-deoxyphosphogluconate aldolase/(4S)-4-hydroxy-2-oxoglutarate aldolase
VQLDQPADALGTIAGRLGAVGVVPVVELPAVEVAVPLAEALVAGGLPCIEITLRTPAAFPGLEAIRRRFPDILLGAGTVLSTEQADAAVSAGADFIVSPGTNPALVEHCLSRGTPILPGVCTPTEIEAARGYGLRTVKFFPAEPMGGASFLRALCGPYRDVHFVPTGGITNATLPDYLALPQVLACGGSWMVKPELLRAGEWGRVTELAAEAAALAASAR